MPNWPEIVQNIERITFKISTANGHGTGFVVQAHEGTITIATAWHVIEELSKIEDKFDRHVKLVSASDSTEIDANAIGTARLGPDGSDTGIVWIGSPFSTEAVDGILKAMVDSEITGGILDLFGGGGVVAISGGRTEISFNEIPKLLPRDEVIKGMEIGWLGYPSVADESPCFFSGRISGYIKSPLLYLVDGTGIPGLSGGPMFDDQGRVLGIISQFLGPDTITMSGVLAAVPIEDVNKMCGG